MVQYNGPTIITGTSNVSAVRVFRLDDTYTGLTDYNSIKNAVMTDKPGQGAISTADNGIQ